VLYRLLTLLIPAALLVPPAAGASGEALQNAYFVCDVFEKTGISSECQVEHVVRRVDVSVETSEAEAEKLCAVMINTLVEKKRYFGAGWKLRVLSPERAQTPLAECALR
jgi:hypothetical protein